MQMPCRLGPLLSGLCLLALCACTHHSAPGWQPVNEAGPVRLAINRQPDIGRIAWRGEIELKHSMVSVLAALADLEQYPAWLYRCQTLETRPGQWGTTTPRLLIDAPWPLADRELWLDNRLRTDLDERSLVIRSTIGTAHAPPPEGSVRITTLENRFLVRPLGAAGTRVIFETRVDPGGQLPGFLSERAARVFPRESLEALAQRLDSGDYALENLDSLPLTFPQLRAMLAPET